MQNGAAANPPLASLACLSSSSRFHVRTIRTCDEGSDTMPGLHRATTTIFAVSRSLMTVAMLLFHMGTGRTFTSFSFFLLDDGLRVAAIALDHWVSSALTTVRTEPNTAVAVRASKILRIWVLPRG